MIRPRFDVLSNLTVFTTANEVLHWWKNVSIFGFKIWPGMYQIFVLIILMINNFQLSKLHTLDMYQIS